MSNDEYLVQPSIGMTRGSALRIEDGRDLLLHVWEGSLWLTQEGDSRDHYLAAGGDFRLDRNGVALAYATRRARVTLTAPAPHLYARRIVLARAGVSEPIELYAAVRDSASFGARLRRFWAGLYAPHARPTSAAL